MSPRLSHPVITHALAVLLGLGGVWLGGRRAPVWRDADASEVPLRTSSGHRPPATGLPASSGDFRQAIQLLAGRDLAGAERRGAMIRLFEEWARRDPAGVIRFLDQVPHWPPDLQWDSWASELARSRPDLLLDLALGHGMKEGLETLAEAGDPATVALLVENLPENDRGEQVSQLLADVQQKLGRAGLPVAAASPAYLHGEAAAALQEGDLDRFLGRFEAIESSEIKWELIAELNSQFTSEQPSDELLALILRLPSEYREGATSGLGYGDLEISENREAQRAWIAKLVTHGLSESAARAVGSLFPSLEPRAYDEIAAWTRTLPADKTWRPVLEAIAQEWLWLDREQVMRRLSEMPPGTNRDAMAKIVIEKGTVDEYLPSATIESVHQLIDEPDLKADLSAKLKSAGGGKPGKED